MPCQWAVQVSRNAMVDRRHELGGNGSRWSSEIDTNGISPKRE
jgi:hypothetical protein